MSSYAGPLRDHTASDKSSHSGNKDADIDAVLSRHDLEEPITIIDYATTPAPENADQAYRFLNQIAVHVEGRSAIQLHQLRRKIDLRLIPCLWLVYTMCWLDKAILNYANVMNLTIDLKLKGNEFSNANTSFYIALTLAELPTGLILNRVSAAKWMGINTILWGLATCAVAASRSYSSLLATRILVAVFEAAVAPCLLLLISRWYTKSEQAPRFCLWYAGLGTGQIIGGLESFGFQHVNNAHFQSWRIMFVVMGSATILLGICLLLFLADDPVKTKWLSVVEKKALLEHISVNQTGVTNRTFVASQLFELLLDVQIWWIVVMTILLCTTSGVISSYSATLLHNSGYTAKQAALLNALSGFVSICTALSSGYGVRRFGQRSLWITYTVAPSILGAALLSFANQDRKSMIFAGIYLVNTCTAFLPHVYQWTAANIAGHTKRPMAMGMVAAAFGAASAIGPQTFQAKDAPLYQPARFTVLITLSIGMLMAWMLALYYRWENYRRDKQTANAVVELTEQQKWGNLTDRQNSAFRYVL